MDMFYSCIIMTTLGKPIFISLYHVFNSKYKGNTELSWIPKGYQQYLIHRENKHAWFSKLREYIISTLFSFIHSNMGSNYFSN